MSVSELVQFYAPLAGLLAVVFWLGVLSEKVRSLQKRVDDLEAEDGAGKAGERLVRLEVKMDGVTDKMESLDRNMSGVQRQLANLVTHPPREFSSQG